ncbi:MAG: AAA family ATPase [Undibacterium umbellatum]|uniref:ATP-dependent nuclease n=1 Tax=Undibacterium umbellatum TaxID=2762300 RepID=UPI003BB52B82
MLKLSRLEIKNLRAIQSATILLPKHAVLIGDNNTGKTTILEAMDLVLGPDRLNRTPPIDEHDFYLGIYKPKTHVLSDVAINGQSTESEITASEPDALISQISSDPTEAPKIEIVATITELSEEQIARFGDYIEFWDMTQNSMCQPNDITSIDADHIKHAIRVTFHGWYDSDEDDFEAKTYFSRSLEESDKPVLFTRKDKQICGFLYLRTIRTGSRALSLERGSLLDIILRLKELRPQMWEKTIEAVAALKVADAPELGITGVLQSINKALKKYVPKEWGVEPHLKVSNLTREHLRKTITAFIATGEGDHAAPFYRQGTGTINMLVLAMLTLIAEAKQNVIFAMEEPETAVPPYAQKRIVHEVRMLASQTIFTSHSPYVMEEFSLDETIVLARNNGKLKQAVITLPDGIKLKRYRQEFRTRFCEGLLARRVLIAEGATEADAFPTVCRRLAELNPSTYTSLEALGICTIDAGGEGSIAALSKLYKDLGKRTFAICDLQSPDNKMAIEAEVEILFMHTETGIENLVLRNTTEMAMRRFVSMIDLPQHMLAKYPTPVDQAATVLDEYFKWTKASWGIADFLAQCDEDEIPLWMREACIQLKNACNPIGSNSEQASLFDDSK